MAATLSLTIRPSGGSSNGRAKSQPSSSGLKVDVIVTRGDAQALAAKRATAVIPIVFGGLAIRSATVWWKA
jgi:hypothetical protein